jgi:hypothetical protein
MLLFIDFECADYFRLYVPVPVATLGRCFDFAVELDQDRDATTRKYVTMTHVAVFLYGPLTCPSSSLYISLDILLKFL